MHQNEGCFFVILCFAALLLWAGSLQTEDLQDLLYREGFQSLAMKTTAIRPLTAEQ